MIWLSEVLLAGVWTAMAAWQAHLIRQNRPIKHGWWALLSLALIAAATRWLLWPMTIRTGLYLAAQLFSRQAVFNIALNRFRGLSWTYVSVSSGSLTDQLEIRLFGSRAWLVEVISGIAFITLHFFL